MFSFSSAMFTISMERRPSICSWIPISYGYIGSCCRGSSRGSMMCDWVSARVFTFWWSRSRLKCGSESIVTSWGLPYVFILSIVGSMVGIVGLCWWWSCLCVRLKFFMNKQNITGIITIISEHKKSTTKPIIISRFYRWVSYSSFWSYLTTFGLVSSSSGGGGV